LFWKQQAKQERTLKRVNLRIYNSSWQDKSYKTWMRSNAMYSDIITLQNLYPCRSVFQRETYRRKLNFKLCYMLRCTCVLHLQTTFFNLFNRESPSLRKYFPGLLVIVASFINPRRSLWGFDSVENVIQRTKRKREKREKKKFSKF